MAILDRAVSFVLESPVKPKLILGVSYSVTISSSQGGKIKDARKTVEVINKERAKGGKIIYVNFLDGAGWIGRQADLKAEPNLEVVYAKGQAHFSSFLCC